MVFSYPTLRLVAQPVHQRHHLPSPLVLELTTLNLIQTVDRNRTVSRRSKPNSRTTLIGEQPNPWNLLQHQDVMSRHRGAKRPRRLELLGIISLLSPAYLLSVKRRTYLSDSSDHYSRLSSLAELVSRPVKRAYTIRLPPLANANMSSPLPTSVTI